MYYVMEEMKHETDTRQIRDDKPIVSMELSGGVWDKRYGQSKRVFNPDGIAPTITAGGGGGTETKIAEPIVLGWTRDEKGNVVNRHPVEVANAVTAAKRDNTQNYVLEEIIEDVRKKYPNRGIFLHEGKIYFIRKLTPCECFRLMGVKEADIDTLLASGISNSQLYKLAGNGIVVNCLTAIFRNLFIK